MDKELALNTIGYIAAGLITICLIPQLLKIISTKNVEDISWLTYTLLLTAELLWLVYGIVLNDLRIIIANAVSATCSMTILILYVAYKRRSSTQI
jgi:MtN3 and saliva related transmembrane protein